MTKAFEPRNQRERHDFYGAIYGAAEGEAGKEVIRGKYVATKKPARGD